MQHALGQFVARCDGKAVVGSSARGTEEIPHTARSPPPLSLPLFDLTFWTDLASPGLISAKPINIRAATLRELQHPLLVERTPTQLEQPAVLCTHGDSKSTDELLPRFSYGVFALQRITE